jgi:hypothetical protein
MYVSILVQYLRIYIGQIYIDLRICVGIYTYIVSYVTCLDSTHVQNMPLSLCNLNLVPFFLKVVSSLG